MLDANCLFLISFESRKWQKI